MNIAHKKPDTFQVVLKGVLGAMLIGRLKGRQMDTNTNTLQVLDQFRISIPFQKLNSSETEIVGQCPFHTSDSNSDHTFNINIETGLWHCWSCQAKGNIQQFIEKYTGLTHDQIDSGINGQVLPSFKVITPKADRHRYLTDLELDILTRYVKGLHEFIKTGKARKWSEYLDKRGICKDAVDHFRLGAGGYIKNYNRHFVETHKGYHKDADNVLRGLNLYNRKQGDYFWSPCVIIPYWSEDQVYYCNSRILPENVKGLKYLYMKGIKKDIFFNDDCIDEYDQVYCVEGEFNAISMWSSGIKNVISFGGKQSFSDNLIQGLYGLDVTLYFDTDRDDPEFRARQIVINKLQDVARSVSYFELPSGIDINDYLKTHSRQEFEDQVLSKAVTVNDPDDFLPSEYRILNDAEKTPVISLEQAQRKTKEFFGGIADNLKAYSGSRTLCNLAVGTGKTTAVVNMLNTRKDAKALILTATHYLCTEYDDQLDFDTFTCHLKGRGHVDVECPYSDKANYMSNRGYSLKFMLEYCKGKCEKSLECLHMHLQEYARNAQILIAVHSYGAIANFFISPYYANKRRRIVVIDENADLVKEVYFSKKDIDYNRKLLEKLLLDKETAVKVQSLIESLDRIELARYSRRNVTLPKVELTRGNIYQIDLAISREVTEDETRPSKLYDIAYCFEHNMTLNYDPDKDSLYYIWRPVFSKRSLVIFLSATTTKGYLEQSLNIKIDHVLGDDIQVRRDNLQIVQLLNCYGGRQKLLKDRERQENVKSIFNAILTKHKDQRIMVVTSLGAGLKGTEIGMTAKDQVIELLQNIAGTHSRRLVSITTEDLENGNVPDSITDIPVIHYSIRGTNLFSEYDVLVELTGNYYNEKSIIEGVKRNFGIDISNSKTALKTCKFRTVDKEYTTEKYCHSDPKVQEFIENNENADIMQSEGRILRGEDNSQKFIYRLHNVNIRPYSDRVYKTWSQMLKSEFGQQELTGKVWEVWNWIRDHKSIDQEFIITEVVNAVGGHRTHIANRHLKGLELLGYIEKVKTGGGRGYQSTYKRIS